MSDTEALARMASPTTGERWFATPRKIATPSWAAGDAYLDQDWTAWYEIGTRGSSTIVAFEATAVSDIFERAADGTWQWIPFPSASDELTPTAPTYGFDVVATNRMIYYDSMTLPTEFTLATGEPLQITVGDLGSAEFPPGVDPATAPTGTLVAAVGGYQIRRYQEPARFVWPDVEPVSAPVGVTFADLYYVLTTPYGMFTPLVYKPFGGIADIHWSIPITTAPSDSMAYLADLNDIGCGERDRDHNTVVIGSLDSDWVIAGTSAHGESIYIPGPDNPIVDPMYQTYSAFATAAGKTPVSVTAFRNAPALVGYKSPNIGKWLVYLNGIYSARSWC